MLCGEPLRIKAPEPEELILNENDGQGERLLDAQEEMEEVNGSSLNRGLDAGLET